MYGLAYNIFIQFTGFILKILPSKKPKLKRWVSGQKTVFQTLEKQTESIKNCIWFHVASLGEFEQAKPLIEAIRLKHPKEKILLTFFSASGYERMKNYEHANLVSYLPLDTKKNVKKFLSLVQPKFALFAKYEYWYNYLTQLEKQAIPAILFSAVFNEGHFFFKWYGKPHSKVLKTYDQIFVQNNDSLKPLTKFTPEVIIAGDTRVDRSLELPKEDKTFPEIRSFQGSKKILIAGSVWEKDMELLSIITPQLKSWNCKLIIAPHEVDENTIKTVRRIFPKAIQHSKLKRAQESDILIVDQIGLLKYLYHYGYVAYIGGGFGKGIHNTLEPAAFGLPVIFGPNHEKFVEALELKNRGAAYSVNSAQELLEKLTPLFLEPASYLSAQTATKQYLQENAGATYKILNYVSQYI